MAATSFKLRDGLVPPDLNRYPPDVRKQYWAWILELGLKAKDRDLAKGLDKDGKPLRPIAAATRKNRRSAMTASGKGDPSAPPLTPAHARSRTRSLLTGKAFTTHASFFWKFDPFTGDDWGQILSYQAEQGRDVMGLSPEATTRVRDAAWDRWRKWKLGTLAKSLVPVPVRATEPVQAPYDFTHAVFGVGATGPGRFATGQWSRPRTPQERRAFLTESVNVRIPGRPVNPPSPHPSVGPGYNRLLSYSWGAGPGGQAGGGGPGSGVPRIPRPTAPKPRMAVAAMKPKPVKLPMAPTPEPFTPIVFARHVITAAESVPMDERWTPTKVWIIDAYHAYKADHPELSLAVFKQRLVELNQARLIDLTRMDLPGELTAEELKKDAASETYQAVAKFHLIRLPK